jgi:hypothetical protein
MSGVSSWNVPAGMDHAIAPLMRDLVRYVADGPRTYAEVMEAWRTSCPRLPVWEEATERGFLVRARDVSGVSIVTVTAAGRAFVLGGAPVEPG